MMIDALVGHLVGDYLLQNDYLALNKKKFAVPCLIHCAIWATSVCLFGGLSFESWVLLFICHAIQDHTEIVSWWMDLIGQHQFRTGVCAPWSTIVVDNVWHIVQIWLAVQLLG